MDDWWGYEGIDDYGSWWPSEIDFSQWPELEPIEGLSPVDIFQGLSPADLEAIFGGISAQEPAAPGGGGASGGLGNILRLLGIGGGGGGLGALGGLAGLFGLGGTIYGGLNNKEATKEAQARMEKAVGEANDTIKGILGGAGDGYKPYADAGASALSKLAALPPSNLAAQFGPIGQASNLAGGVRPVGQLSNLASQFRPLGSGRGMR